MLFLPLLIILLAPAREPALRIEAAPRVQLYHRDTQEHLRLFIAHDARSRSLCIEVDGPTYYSDCMDFVGLGAPYAVERWIPGLQPGTYTATGTVGLEGGSQVSRSVQFCVVGEDERCGLGDEP